MLHPTRSRWRTLPRRHARVTPTIDPQTEPNRSPLDAIYQRIDENLQEL